MSLLDAVKFISHAQRSKGNERATHSLVRYGHIVANDGLLAAGSPIAEDDLNCCPQTDRLRLALERCGTEHQIVQSDDSLFLHSGEFSAYIPLCDAAKLAVAVPDPALGPLGEAFRTALRVVGSLVRDSAPTLLQSCLQLDTSSCIATNGFVILQYWHGFDMPPGLLVPKQFVDAVCRIKKPISAFGFSQETFTIHFEGDCWLRTNLFRERIPNMEAKLSDEVKRTPWPDGFFEQAALVAKFSEDGDLYLNDSLIRSHKTGNLGCYQSYPMKDIPSCVIYQASTLAAIAKYATHFNCCSESFTMIYGENLRGAIAHRFMRPSVTEYGHGFYRDENESCMKRKSFPCTACGGEWTAGHDVCPHCGDNIPF